jgi:hypothetical protein
MKAGAPLMYVRLAGISLGGVLLTLTLVGPDAAAQRGRGASPQPPQSPRSLAPIDVTGYWVSVVTEDWRWRMVTPQKGDVTSVPLNAEGRRVAGLWDLANDDAAGNQCKAYGVGGIMRQPGRLHITWLDDNTLKLDVDAGTQTRILSFDKTKQASGEKTWQGYSSAAWEGPVRRPGRGDGPEAQFGIGGGTGFGDVPGGGGQGLRGMPAPRRGALDSAVIKVETTNFREGYLRKNGVPYSETAIISEYFQWLPPHPNGDDWLVVTTAVDDPKYLQQPFYTSTNFKREPNGSKWNPTPCKTDPPASK